MPGQYNKIYFAADSDTGGFVNLSETALFSGVSREDMTDILNRAGHKNFTTGEILFRQGEPCHSIFYATDGRIKLLQSDLNGRETLLDYIGAGDLLAVVSGIMSKPYPVTAKVIHDGQCLFWNSAVFLQLMTQYPLISINALRIVSRRFHTLQRRFLELSNEKVEQRIARTLLRLAKTGGENCPEGILLNFPVSRQDIAEYAGTTLFTVSRTLSRWEHSGYLQLSREKIIIRQMTFLEKTAKNLS